MKLTRREAYKAAEAAAASTTAASTGSVRWQQITVGLLFAVLLGVYAWAKYYDGPVWTPDAVTVTAEPEEMELLDQYRYSCHANTIIAGSYGACRDHRSCQLSNDEMMIMYVAGKTAVIDCKKFEMLDLFIDLNEERITLENLDLDDAFKEDDEDDEPTGKQRIGL